MKIGIDARNIYQLESGDGRYSISMIRALAQIDKENEYIIWVRPGKEDLFKVDNPKFKIKAIDIPAYSPQEQLFMPFVIMKEKIDLYHSYCFSMPLLTLCPSIVTIYDIIFLHFPQFYSSFKSWVSKMLIGLCSRRSTRIVTISSHSKLDIINNFSNNLADKIKIIYCGHAPQFRVVDKDKAKRYVKDRYAIVDDYILYVGNMNPHKNISTLIKTFKVCLDDNLGLKLVICGKKKQSYPILKNLVQGLNLESEVFFIDDANDETEVMLYNAAKIFIFLSLYEGFGMPPIEAMACGLPVIASNSSSIPEVLKDAAYFVDPKNIPQIHSAIKDIISNDNLYLRLRHNGLEQSKLYKWNNSAYDLLNLYREVFSEAKEQERVVLPKKVIQFEDVKDYITFSNNPKVSVIIPSFDGFREGNLKRLIKDLESQSYHDFEIHVIKRVSPQGKAINLGAMRAKGELLMILDDDTRIGNHDIIKNLIDSVEKDNSIGMAGASILVPPDANWLQKKAGSEFPRFGMQVVHKITESDMACHGCCVIPKKVFEEVGGERENILRGLDPDLRYRLRSKGYKVVLAPNTWAYHPLPGTLGKLIETFFRNGLGSAYCLKYEPELIYDTDEILEMKSFKPRIPFLLRIFRFPLRLVKALIEFKFLRLLAYFVYAGGFLYGILKYTLFKNGFKDIS